MAAYMIFDIEVTDPAAFEQYRKLARASIEAFGGRYIVRGGRHETLEGEWPLKRVVILEFASHDQARAWWSSAEYRDAKALRLRSAKSRMFVVEGV